MEVQLQMWTDNPKPGFNPKTQTELAALGVHAIETKALPPSDTHWNSEPTENWSRLTGVGLYMLQEMLGSAGLCSHTWVHPHHHHHHTCASTPTTARLVSTCLGSLHLLQRVWWSLPALRVRKSWLRRFYPVPVSCQCNVRSDWIYVCHQGGAWCA